MGISLCVICCFSLAAFNICSLCLIFVNLIKMCLGVFHLEFSGFLKDNLNLSWCVTVRLHSEMLGIRQNLVVFFLMGESKVSET